MANQITTTLIDPSNGLVTKSSRYANSKVIYYGNNNVMTFTTYKKQIKPSDADRFTVISSDIEYRPDLLSLKVYGIVDYWWKILEVNEMKDVFDFKAGVNIRIPSGF